MTYPLRARALIVAAVAALGLTSAHADKAVPFRATVLTQEVLVFDPARCPVSPFLVGRSTGTGQATHMGRVTVESTDCVTPGPVPLPMSFTFTDGQLTITAANGDTLHATYAGALQAATVPTLFALSGSYTITGGTGRFAHATGAGSLVGANDIATQRGSYVAAGVISY